MVSAFTLGRISLFFLSFKHENFNENTLLNDIALILLSKPVQFSQNVQPACLPNPNYGNTYPLANQSAITSGWVKY
jgi:hypothetical protein